MGGDILNFLRRSQKGEEASRKRCDELKKLLYAIRIAPLFSERDEAIKEVVGRLGGNEEALKVKLTALAKIDSGENREEVIRRTVRELIGRKLVKMRGEKLKIFFGKKESKKPNIAEKVISLRAGNEKAVKKIIAVRQVLSRTGQQEEKSYPDDPLEKAKKLINCILGS